MRKHIRTDGEHKNIFEILAMLEWEPDPRLMDLEARLMAGEFDQTQIRFDNNPFKGSKKQMRFLCDQKLTWEKIAEIFGETKERCIAFANRHGIKKQSCVGRPKITDPQKKMENRIRYYERVSPSAEKLDQLMILYGGFIGLLAFKLNKPFRIARSILKYRGKYQNWIKYNYYLGRGGKPRELKIIEIN